ncbi:MAG: deoxyribonuclease IV [Candidatus Cloacimonetes bacterium]|nr:deoxyribonuclease IV [Candidatus Cloacimonadota bacterium]MCF7813219.1 deoxyribonuclease IV [Candidatus Cloacimonadota bacterium]MCF7867418.1 deoxyribonuclease IV [Candidatus Cloacimonadota bacterium]MCF7882950.1 deoxyribonuclease IV [Candidatus Cloacimonadota bacterium]
MKYIGAHVSIAGGVENAPGNANEIEAKAFGMFTKNQRQWKAKPFTNKNIENFKIDLKANGFKPEHVLPHDTYLINLGHPEREKLEKSRKAFLDELQRCEQLDLKLLNFHPGSSLGKISEEECLKTVADSINWAIDRTDDVIAVIENTAGMGNHVGHSFEQIAFIVEHVENKDRVGICYDTCHGFTAGYDIRTKTAFEKTFADFDKMIGMNYLKGMHLNDSKKEFASNKDRHESIGKGFIGLDAFKFIMNDKRFDNIPLILETPNSEIWKDEIKMLYDMIE